MPGSEKGHVHFDAIDPEKEEARAARGQQHRRDVVRGIKWHAESEKTIRVVQMKDGYDFIKGLSNFQALSQQSLGVKLTVQGFLTFFYEKIANGMADMEAMFKYFKESDLEVEKMGPKLQEHLILIALLTAEDGYYGLPDAESVGTAMVDSGDESDHSSKKPRIDKP